VDRVGSICLTGLGARGWGPTRPALEPHSHAPLSACALTSGAASLSSSALQCSICVMNAGVGAGLFAVGVAPR
jgi:hypothetical protein